MTIQRIHKHTDHKSQINKTRKKIKNNNSDKQIKFR